MQVESLEPLQDLEHPIRNGNRFENPKSFNNWTGLASLPEILRWVLTRKRSNIPSEQELDKTLPIQHPSFDEHRTTGMTATWLGHATMLVTIDNVTFITDPIWASHASPIWGFGPRRYRRPVCEIAELPQIHFGLISHNHYDHLDRKAVVDLQSRFVDMHWFVPLGLRQWMESVGCVNVHEMNWCDRRSIKVTTNDGEKLLTICCLPVQHWSARAGYDRFKTLWSSWAVIGDKHRFYFAGDTGFCDKEFAKIGTKLGPFDLAAIPIGCYEPEWIMKPTHIGPYEAVRIHQLVRARHSIGIHWGTYRMGSSEFYLAPKETLKKEAESLGLLPTEFITTDHGAAWRCD